MRHSAKLVTRLRPRCPILEVPGVSSFAADMGVAAPHYSCTAHLSLPSRPPCTPHRGEAQPRHRPGAQLASVTSATGNGPLLRLQHAVRQDACGMAEPMLHSGTASAAQPLQHVRPPPGCQAPLCERPAQHVVAADALRAWRQSAIAAVEEVGDAHAAQDGGSTARELKARPHERERQLCIRTLD